MSLAVHVGMGLAITIALESWQVHIRGSWAYAEEMPVVFGIGLSPLGRLQPSTERHIPESGHDP